MIKVAERLGAEAALIADLKAAKQQTRFSTAIESIKHALPQALFISGHNPLTLLHSALSDGLHKRTDDECLAIAVSIRVLLSELAERIGQVLKDEAELQGAVRNCLT